MCYFCGSALLDIIGNKCQYALKLKFNRRERRETLIKQRTINFFFALLPFFSVKKLFPIKSISFTGTTFKKERK
jgi:hypothetical protein